MLISLRLETSRCLSSFYHCLLSLFCFFFFFQAEDGIRDYKVTGVQTCALPILDLVHDHGPHAAQHLAGALGREDQIERLRGGDEDVRGAQPHLLALRARRVAGAYQRADLHIRQAQGFERAANLGERLRQVLLHVVGERLERRDVHHLRPVGERPPPVQSLTQQRVDGGEERRECLARARGGRDQGIAACLDERPRTLLRLGGLAEAGLEPALNGGMKTGQRHPEIWRRFTEAATPPATPRCVPRSPRSCCSASTRPPSRPP